MFNNKIQRQLDDLKKDLDTLKNVDWRLEIERLKTQVISLRGLVNRKLGGDQQNTQEKDIYSGMLLPENGFTK